MPATPDKAGLDPVSDEKLQRITVGERKPHNAPITLAEYDPEWPGLFVAQV